MELYEGDLVKIRVGSRDIDTGRVMTRMMPYSEYGTLRARVQLIDEFDTRGKYGLPRMVERIKLVNEKDEVVWQGLRSSIAGNIIRAKAEETKYEKIPETNKVDNTISTVSNGEFTVATSAFGSKKPYLEETIKELNVMNPNGTDYKHRAAGYEVDDGTIDKYRRNGAKVTSPFPDTGNLKITQWRGVD